MWGDLRPMECEGVGRGSGRSDRDKLGVSWRLGLRRHSSGVVEVLVDGRECLIGV